TRSKEARENNHIDDTEDERRPDSPAHGKFHITKIPKMSS
ncbi:unnamed protein product, partial [marine sediment metagenome]